MCATALHTRVLNRRDAWLLAAMFVGSLVLYAATAARTVTGEDAGELLAAAHDFGVPHPSGYPLWLLLGWLFDHALPFGTVAWRVSMVSAVASAAANTILLALALKTVHHRLAACAGAAFFAVSLTHWTQAVIPEIYGLHVMFMVLMGLLLVRLAERPSAGRLLALATACGFAAVNHHMAIPVVVLALVGAMLVWPRALRRPVLLGGTLLSAVLPHALYFVLMAASAHDPYMDWGNPETLGALWDHATRSQYAGYEKELLQTVSGYDDYVARLGLLAGHMGGEFGSVWPLLLAGIGFFTLLITQRGLWLYMIGMGWICSVLVTRWANYSFDREYVYANHIFYIPAWMTLGWLMAGGLDTVLHSFDAWQRRTVRSAGPAFGGSVDGRRLVVDARAGLVLLLAVGLGHAALDHYSKADRSRTTGIAEFAKSILDTMEPGSLYFPSSDHSTFPVLYWQGVEGYRLDVKVGDKIGAVEADLVRDYLMPEDGEHYERLRGAERRAFLEAVLIQRWPGAVYFANKRDMADCPGLTQVVKGPLYKVVTESEAAAWWTPDEDGMTPGLAAWEAVEAVLADIDDRQAFDFTTQMVKSDLLAMKGLALHRSGRPNEAITTWERIDERFDLAPLKQTYNNIACALAETNDLKPALGFFARALAVDDDYRLAWINKSAVHERLDQTARAILCLETVLEIDGKDTKSRLQLARLLGRADERVVEALAHYEALAVADEDDPQPWREAGLLLERVGDHRKAKTAFEESLKRDGDQLAIAERLDRIRQGIASLGAELPSGPGQVAHALDLTAAPLRAPSPVVPEGLPVPVVPEPTPILPHAASLQPIAPRPASVGLGPFEDTAPVLPLDDATALSGGL
jgi:hypothetical protein